MATLFQHIKPLHLFLLLACLSFAPSFNLQREYKGDDNPDMHSYLQMAEGDYDTSPIRRYRWIIPTICQGVAAPIVYFKPDLKSSFTRFTFFVVNWLLMALSCTLLFLFLKSLKIQPHFAFLATLIILLSRWSIYFSAIPIVDSLYFFTLIAFCYGIVSHESKWLWIALLIGPIAKESFFLFFPLLYFAKNIKWKHRGLMVLTSLALFLISRTVIDALFMFQASESIEADLNHLNNITTSLKLLASPTGIKDVLMILGLAWGILLLGIKKWRTEVPPFLYAVIIIALVHALLSTSVGRMLFLAFPFLAWALAKSMEHISQKWTLKVE